LRWHGPTAYGGSAHYLLHEVATMNLNFVLPATEVGTITVAGNDPVENDGQLRYTSMHADFMNGWNQAVLTDLVTKCIKNVPQRTPDKQKPPECRDPGRE
jgi:hypothetical protein